MYSPVLKATLFINKSIFLFSSLRSSGIEEKTIPDILITNKNSPFGKEL